MPSVMNKVKREHVVSSEEGVPSPETPPNGSNKKPKTWVVPPPPAAATEVVPQETAENDTGNDEDDNEIMKRYSSIKAVSKGKGFKFVVSMFPPDAEKKSSRTKDNSNISRDERHLQAEADRNNCEKGSTTFMGFGKYANRTYQWVVTNDTQYVHWLQRQAIDDGSVIYLAQKFLDWVEETHAVPGEDHNPSIPKMGFGKYADESYQWVAENDVGYVLWMQGQAAITRPTGKFKQFLDWYKTYIPSLHEFDDWMMYEDDALYAEEDDDDEGLGYCDDADDDSEEQEGYAGEYD